MKDSLFTKIINGEIPCHKVYEDEKTFAFMDIYPIQPGHVLVVSKTPYETFLDMPPADYQALMNSVQKIAKKIKSTFPGKRRVGVMIEGLDVNHVHVKLFPINTGDEFRHSPDTSTEPDHKALAVMAEKLKIE